MSTKFQASVQHRGDVSYVKLGGVIDEDNELADLVEKIPSGTAVIDLGEIERINSCGVREWVNFIRTLSQSRQVRLLRCSMPIVEQLNMVFNFRGTAAIESFFAPFCCSNCGASTAVLLTPADAPQASAAPRRCDQCGGSSVFDDLPERYFAFLLEFSA